jgi:hypothetical protein
MSHRDLRAQQECKGVLALLEKRGTKDHQDLQDYKDP